MGMLSVVVNFHNNRREARNTLFALTRAYQKLDADFNYEVIAIDHGSKERLSEAEVRSFGREFSCRYVETDRVSPVRAINAACREAAGDWLLVMIDGAHIITPGVFRWAANALRLFGSAFVATVPFHLGPKAQSISVTEGYNQQVEDELLTRVDWKSNGYRLFQASQSLQDGCLGWFGCLFETGCFAITKADYMALGGYEERFESPGGGIANLDLFRRALEVPELQYVMLLGEGTFHQVHGGVASNALRGQHPWDKFNEEYARIRGRPFERIARRPIMMGTLPTEALVPLRGSAALGLDFWANRAGGG
jgi:glycosyltransferase involved in cell wall biosynthesis